MASVTITKNNDNTTVGIVDGSGSNTIVVNESASVYHRAGKIYVESSSGKVLTSFFFSDVVDKLGADSAGEYITALGNNGYFLAASDSTIHRFDYTAVTSNRQLTENDIVFGGQKVTLIPDTNGTTRIVALDNIGEIGDVIEVSGNYSQPTAVLEVMGGTSTIENLTTGYNSVTVEDAQYATIVKIGDNSYKAIGSYTEVTSEVYSALNATNLIYETNASTGITLDNSADGTVTVETTDPHSGDFYLRFVANGNDADWSLTIVVDGLTIGETYQVSIWLRQPVGSGAGVYWSTGFTETGIFPGGNVTSNSSTWQQRTEASVANATSCNFGVYDATNTAGDTIEIDSISVRRVIV